jgi:hypothetical protein
LQSIFTKKMSSYLTLFKVRCLNKRKVDTLKRLAISLTLVTTLRDGFLRWKERASLEQLKKDLNDEGPIREEDFAYRS